MAKTDFCEKDGIEFDRTYLGYTALTPIDKVTC